MAVLTVHELSKQYPNSRELAVKEVSFTVEHGEFMVLLGPSGCGKSSVLRMIAGLEPITAGTVSIDGRVVNAVPARDRDIAMVFQSYALYPHMNVYDNLAFGLRRRGVGQAELDQRVQAAAAKLSLLPFLQRKPQALSGGQRQRVALGRAIVRNPKVFLFDEPLSNLDAALRVTTRNELIKQQDELGTTTVYVTHDQVEAMTMGDRICIMNGGEVVQIGRPLDVYRNPVDTFVARFLGNPQMNMLAGRLETQEERAVLDLAGIPLRLPGKILPGLAKHAGKRALVMDGEEPFLHMVRETFSEHGYQVDIARDGEAALRRMKQTPYDLALCDWKMPGLNGQQIYERVRATDLSLSHRMIFITGDVINEKAQQFLQEHRKLCLSKPFSLVEFRAVIGKALAVS